MELSETTIRGKVQHNTAKGIIVRDGSAFRRSKRPDLRGRTDGLVLTKKQELMAQAIANPAFFGEIVLGFNFYPKQREALELCAPAGCRVSIACANGGGKTRLLIPTLVLWHQSIWPGGITKVTSGSYPQIEEQVWPAIEAHKEKFQKFRWFETPYFESVDQDTKEKGFCSCFATNHPGRAEGHHELGPNRPLLYIVDEAKTTQPWLRGVLEARVRPTRLVLLSSHGFAEGWFYDTQTLRAEVK